MSPSTSTVDNGADIDDDVSADELLHLYREMSRIRQFEEEAGTRSESGELPGFLHLYSGQEAVAVGVMSHLRREDQITSTHRGHGHLLAKGGDMRLMFAELYGKATGYCGGKGGSMHICDPELGILGSNGIVAAGPPIAVGAAFANQYRGSDNVAVSFFGDGASNEGAFHEALNMAALFKLPCIFVCENNLYGEFTSQARHQVVTDIAERAAGYGMPGVVVDGMDVLAVRRAAGEAIERGRSGGGPTLIECKTYRFHNHVGMRNLGPVYREQAEVDEWRLRDPLLNLARVIEQRRAGDADTLAALRADVDQEVAAGVSFGQDSPAPGPDSLILNVYSNAIYVQDGGL